MPGTVMFYAPAHGDSVTVEIEGHDETIVATADEPYSTSSESLQRRLNAVSALVRVGEEQESEPAEPTASSTRAEWDEFAEGLGIDASELPNKDAVIEAVEAARAAEADKDGV